MLLRLALLSVLIAACYASSSSMIEIAEKMYKPCILHKIGCPPDGSLDLEKFKSTVQTMVLYKPPKACKCNLRRPKCVRKCYYAYTVKTSLASAVAGKTSAAEIAAARASTLKYLHIYIRPCVTGEKDCGSTFSLHVLRAAVKNLLSSYTLPSECNCDTQREMCIRRCYYAYVVQMMVASATTTK